MDASLSLTLTKKKFQRWVCMAGGFPVFTRVRSGPTRASCFSGIVPRRRSAGRTVQLAREVLELAAQLLVAEDLVEGGRLQLLDRLEGGRRIAHQVAQLEADLHRLEGVVGDPEVVGGALARAGHLLALLQQIAPVALGR